MTPKIKIKLDTGAAMPHRAHPSDIGADIKAWRTWLIQGDGTEHELESSADCYTMKYRSIDCAKIKIDTGVHATPPPGFYIELVPNSRLAKTPFVYANSFGVIDPEYTGSMKVILNTVNSITPGDLMKFLPGNVVGQLILRRRYDAEFEQVDTLKETARGDGGFGSTESLADMMFAGVKKCSPECPHFHTIEDAPEGMEHCGFCAKDPDPYPHATEIGFHCVHEILAKGEETGESASTGRENAAAVMQHFLADMATDRRCIDCSFFMMGDHTCAHPGSGFPSADLNAPACPNFEPEQKLAPEP